MPIGNMTPTTIDVQVEEITQIMIAGFVEYTFYINGQEYKRLPLDANVREPDSSKSKPYKDMLRTLEEEPEKFLENNLGISVIASKVQCIGNKRYRLTFPSGTGILNGGHTQLAILDSKSNPNISKAIVKVSVREKAVDPLRIAEIAAAQNSSTAVKEYSLAEKKGLFAKLKAYMHPDNEKHIIWYEGKTVAANLGMVPTDLIAMINLYDFTSHMSNYSTSSSQPTASCSSKSSVFNNWVTDSSSYEKVYPLINDIIRLSEYIQMDFPKKTGMGRLQIVMDSKNKSSKQLVFSGEVPQYLIPKAFLYSVMSAFRANIYYDGVNKQVGWFEDPLVLYKNNSVDLFKEVANAYKGSYKNDIKRVGNDPMLWKLLFMQLNTRINTKDIYVKYDI